MSFSGSLCLRIPSAVGLASPDLITASHRAPRVSWSIISGSVVSGGAEASSVFVPAVSVDPASEEAALSGAVERYWSTFSAAFYSSS